ncbi:hypothetical protein [Hydrogenophaga sp.]|uniref:hypothetical protein n=1 Tax=Hydrogenophaga sp. TaxID=1904254 RepID=UPI003D294DD6
MPSPRLWVPALAALLTAGCASIAVTDEAIVDRTAFALNLDKDAFTVSNRVNDGTTTRYAVRTKTGQEFNCFVGDPSACWGARFRKRSAAARVRRPRATRCCAEGIRPLAARGCWRTPARGTRAAAPAAQA